MLAPIRKRTYVRMDKDNHQIIFPFEQRKLAYKKPHKRNMKVFLRNHANFFSFSLFYHKQQKPSSNDKKWHKGSPDPQERKLRVQIQLNQQNTTEPAEDKDDQLPHFQGPKFSEKSGHNNGWINCH